MTSVHAIIINWNNYDDIVASIGSLRASEAPVARVLVVDNGSTDGSFERLEACFAGTAAVELIRHPVNAGFAVAANIGVERCLAAGATHLLFVNNDAEVSPDALGRLLEVAQSEPSAGLVGPRIFYHGDPERVWQGGGRFDRLKTDVVVPEKNRVMTGEHERREVTFLTACVLLVRREVFEAGARFDEDLFFYCEDAAFCLTTRALGFRAVYAPDASAWHRIESITGNRTSPFVMYHLARSRIILLRKHFSAPYFGYAMMLHFLLFTPHRMLQIVRGSRSRRAAGAWFRGTLDGLRGGNRKERAHEV